MLQLETGIAAAHVIKLQQTCRCSFREPVFQKRNQSPTARLHWHGSSVRLMIGRNTHTLLKDATGSNFNPHDSSGRTIWDASIAAFPLAGAG